MMTLPPVRTQAPPPTPQAPSPTRRPDETPPAAVPAPPAAQLSPEAREQGHEGAHTGHLAALGTTFGEPASGPTPASVHRTQMADPRFNPGGQTDPNNADCGPTALSMGLEMIGRRAPGVTGNSGAQENIDRTRLAMHPHDQEGDGLGPDGTRSVKEHGRDTGYGHIRRGAEASGATTRRVTGVQEIEQAVLGGSPVVATGNPSARGSYGSRVGNDAEAHFIAITGANAETHRFTINDPMNRTGPIEISREELGVFLARGTGNSVGLALSPAP